MSFEINRRLVAERAPLDSAAEIDSVTADIIRGAFETICFESRGPSRPVRLVCDHQPVQRAQRQHHRRPRSTRRGISVGIPQLLFISPLCGALGLEHYEQDDWGPGDVFVGNDPDHGGGHLPDYNGLCPLSSTPRASWWRIQALQAHQGDTGGKDPGGFSVDAMEIFARGHGQSRGSSSSTGAERSADDILDLLVRNNRLPVLLRRHRRR